MLASVRDEAVRLVFRSGHPFTNLFGPVSDALSIFRRQLCWTVKLSSLTTRGSPTS